jgi:cell division topological specificity factor
MGLLDYLLKSRKKTAGVAKDRLSIIVAREGFRARSGPHYLPQLKQELLQVLAKYEKIDLDQVTVNVEKSGDTDVLELNVVLTSPEAPTVPFTPPPSTRVAPAAMALDRLRNAQSAPRAWWER